jgi:hypothetical protein
VRQALIDDVDAFRAKMTDCLSRRKAGWNTSNEANDTAQKLIDLASGRRNSSTGP